MGFNSAFKGLMLWCLAGEGGGGEEYNPPFDFTFIRALNLT